MFDGFLNWVLDGVNSAIDSWPIPEISLPSLTGLTGPLSEVNWLIDLQTPWQIALAILLLGPGLLFVTLSLYMVGLLTPTSTTR
jgi:hypothetical protein